MIEGALSLLARHGLQATSFNEVLDLTKTPRGSIYHHFPSGKNEMIAEALRLLESRTLGLIEEFNGKDAIEVTKGFLGLWHYLLENSDYGAGCSAVAVSVATESQELLERASSIFQSWRVLLSEELEKGGLTAIQAQQFAVALIAASEGAVVMCRSEKSMEPLNIVSKQLVGQVKNLLKASKR
jgi:TetR/AcrR family transcriptional repressor of lmrAB and yxaGH operons